MTRFPPSEILHSAAVQAFVDPQKPDCGYVRFETAGKIHTFQLSFRDFERLARDIQNEVKRKELQVPAHSKATDPK